MTLKLIAAGIQCWRSATQHDAGHDDPVTPNNKAHTVVTTT